MRNRHQRAQPDAPGARERAQPVAHEPAVLAEQRDDVGDRGERHELELVGTLALVEARPSAQRLCELHRHSRGAELLARVGAEHRVHDRRVGQRAVGARRVVVRDKDVESGAAGRRDGVDRSDRAVGSDQQARAARGEPLDGRRREPVAIAEPVG